MLELKGSNLRIFTLVFLISGSSSCLDTELCQNQSPIPNLVSVCVDFPTSTIRVTNFLWSGQCILSEIRPCAEGQHETSAPLNLT